MDPELKTVMDAMADALPGGAGPRFMAEAAEEFLAFAAEHLITQRGIRQFLTHSGRLLPRLIRDTADRVGTPCHITRAGPGLLPTSSLDLAEPVAVLLSGTPAGSHGLDRLRDHLPAGSALALVQCVGRADLLAEIDRTWPGAGYPRTPEQLVALFGDWELEPPGLADVEHWPLPSGRWVWTAAGIAIKPATQPTRPPVG